MTATVDLSGIALLVILGVVALVAFVSGVAWAVNENMNRQIALGELPDFRRRQLERLSINEEPTQVRVLRPQPRLFDYDDPEGAA